MRLRVFNVSQNMASNLQRFIGIHYVFCVMTKLIREEVHSLDAPKLGIKDVNQKLEKTNKAIN